MYYTIRSATSFLESLSPRRGATNCFEAFSPFRCATFSFEVFSPFRFALFLGAKNIKSFSPSLVGTFKRMLMVLSPSFKTKEKIAGAGGPRATYTTRCFVSLFRLGKEGVVFVSLKAFWEYLIPCCLSSHYGLNASRIYSIPSGPYARNLIPRLREQLVSGGCLIRLLPTSRVRGPLSILSGLFHVPRQVRCKEFVLFLLGCGVLLFSLPLLYVKIKVFNCQKM